MSIAGIRSNRGDVYQTLVAFDWALRVLSDPDFKWLEVDSVSYSVDDIVIGRADGSVIACQCKKNQIDFRSWTISDLGEELDKAFLLLANHPLVNVRFYSRSNFGELAKLKEHSSSQPDETTFLKSLGKVQLKLNNTLSKQLAKTAPGFSTFEFLQRTNFVTSDDFERMEEVLRERLRSLVSSSDAAFNALWTNLDQLGARISTRDLSASIRHRLTKDDLRSIVQQAGATLVPPMDLTEIRHSFSSTSSIGRSWRRDISGQRIINPILNKLLDAIDVRKKSVLVTGLPGSGKTCVMLELQEVLEERAKNDSDLIPLFIQSREFADLITPDEREAQGLPSQWVEKAARLSESSRVIVIIDSMDVLSIAREHQALQYFLAQIDRLLFLPNITVITTCRDFDRHYDRRISERNWELELQCQPLDWDTNVAPLLDRLGITITNIDPVTRELICNPRELTLFTELSLQHASVNVTSSQSLAQHYLNTIVLADSRLGDIALQAIEDIAAEMLSLRSLTIPHQRFPASQAIQRKLCSLNILQETRDGKLTFGHQTLLDTLVISRAIRNGVTLNEFITSLPPVPFVRPSIRSFIAQLAQGERREFKKQLRVVLTGKVAFHIKRLAAGSFAEQNPKNEDWSLIRSLREEHRDIFQVIYTSGKSIEWHHFWLKYLVPDLQRTKNIEDTEIHVNHIAQWRDTDTAGVAEFWMKVLKWDWFESPGIAERIAMHLFRIKPDNIHLVVPLLKHLLSMPRSNRSSLGKVIAGCVNVGAVDDALLWKYITDDIQNDDIYDYQLNQKLRCGPHEFGNINDNFIHHRMEVSDHLLDLAVSTIESWSKVRLSRYGKTRLGYRDGFLRDTSYQATHSQRDIYHMDGINILFNAVEAAVIHHARVQSGWWKTNCNRICFNQEGALIYFGILACTASPENNIHLISRILCDKNMLEFHLSFELACLIQSAFIFLSYPQQDAVMACILSVRDQNVSEEYRLWRLKLQTTFIGQIPCYLRSIELQEKFHEYETESGIISHQPDIYSASGWVSSPYPHDVLLEISNNSVLKLLSHYEGYSHRERDVFFTGGEEEAGKQLTEAASMQPSRFMSLLYNHWSDISPKFCNDIMSGIANYLGYRYGNLINKLWEPLEEPDTVILVNQILDELERHPHQWRRSCVSAKALEACSSVITDQQQAERLVFLSIDFAGMNERDTNESDNIDLTDIGINMIKGDIAKALMNLANNIKQQGGGFPVLLPPTLRRFACDEHPAIRALILLHLPLLQSRCFDFGWDLFHLAIKDSTGLWKSAEPCLYYAYHEHFEIVKPLLLRLRNEETGKNFEIWGRISALASLSGYIDFNEFIRELNTLDSTDAWAGAATVWINNNNIQQHQEQCIAGISAGLNAGGMHALKVAGKMDHIFDDNSGLFFIPSEIISRCLSAFREDSSGERIHHQFYRFPEWLNAVSQQSPEQALIAAEIYLNYIYDSKRYLYDDSNSLTQLLNRLFEEAEEREESDNGEMLGRVVALQDMLLSIGVDGVEHWLTAAERP